MKKIIVIIFIILLSLSLFADQRDSSLYAYDTKTKNYLEIKSSQKYVFKLKDGKILKTRYNIKNDSTLLISDWNWANTQEININQIETIYGENYFNVFYGYGLAVLSVGGLLLSSIITVPAGITITIMGLSPVLFFTLLSIALLIGATFLLFSNKKYSSKKYNFKIKE